MDRRQFLMGVSGVSIALIPAYALLSGFSPLKKINLENISPLSSQQAASLKVLLEHLLPSELETPGAREINATGYLRGILENTKLNKTSRTFLLEGIQNLERIAYSQTQKHFFELVHDEREKVSRALEATKAGNRWLKEILEFLMEALLSDPVYGGNTGEVGWKWLQHTPGFPRPLQNKRYFLL